MQIVIDIPKKIYKASQIIGGKFDDVIQIPLEVIANCTVLPEKHGRLIDADTINCWLTEQNIKVVSKWQLDNAPTILEAWGNEE